MFKDVFPSWTHEKQFKRDLIDQYPLLIGIYRDTNNDYLFDYLIKGLTTKPDVNEFLNIVHEFKDKFYANEEQLAKAKVIDYLFDTIKCITSIEYKGRSETKNVSKFITKS